MDEQLQERMAQLTQEMHRLRDAEKENIALHKRVQELESVLYRLLEKLQHERGKQDT